MGRKRSNGKLPPFVALTWKLLNSKAYIDLKPSAAKALPYFLGKIKAPHDAPERYTEEFPFSYTEAKRFGFASTTHSRDIAELVEKGFIDPAYRGGMRSFGLTSNRFRLSRRWEDYGTPAFRGMSWKEVLPEFAPKVRSPALHSPQCGGVDSDKQDGQADALKCVVPILAIYRILSKNGNGFDP